MSSFSEFRDELRKLLAHLYDPTYTPKGSFAESLKGAMGREPRDLRTVITQAIQELKPPPHIPLRSHAWRLHQVLVLRYLEQLTQEEAAERLAITVRHLAREQAQAVEILARLLWTEVPFAAPQAAEQSPEAGDWRSQVHQELASLQDYRTHAVANVGRSLHDVVQLATILATRRGVLLTVDESLPDVMAGLHPSVLSQALVAAISYLVRGLTSGQVHAGISGSGDEVTVVLTGSPITTPLPGSDWLGQELLVSQGGRLELQLEGQTLRLTLSLPGANQATVLIIDDNQDLMHLYRRCLATSSYRVINLQEGARVFEAIEAATPNVIILDLMLPDVDGWELLAKLHEHPISRAIPVIVCSVIQEDDLALALGAEVCLHKPVRCQDLIRALDEVMDSSLP